MNLRNCGEKGIPYSIGIDLGTASVGWAVIDEQGELFHFKGKPTWGSRLFSSAETASAARINRGQRRRYDRRRQRLDLLQEIFCPSMEEVDPEFFIRLGQTRLLPEDRDSGHREYRWPFFNDSDFTEADYYRRFPTIYHLRTSLMESEEPADLRLIYLALHNIVKTRGNFLWQDNPNLSAASANMEIAVNHLCETLEVWCDEHEVDLLADFDKDTMRSILEGAESKREKQSKLQKLFVFDKEHSRAAKALSSAPFGYVVEFGDIFGEDEKKEGSKFSLDKEDRVEAYLALCPDDGAELFEALQMLRSAIILLNILDGGDGRTISYHKVDEYERYRRDLKTLKQLVREYAPEQFDRFFRGVHYADPRWAKDYDPAKAQGYTLYNTQRKRSYEDFRKDVVKLFKGTGAEADGRYTAMIKAFDEERFLRRLKTGDNGSIPYQLHLEEMRAIIKKQGLHHPFLLREQAKLESLVAFRIPYYVGPLTTKNAPQNSKGDNRFAWSVRYEGDAGKQPIRPWNWEEVIDKDASAEAFIRRMTGTCTYVYGEPVLPKCSLLYERFCVLNELNGARYSLDGDKWYRFDYSDRVEIMRDLFERGTTVKYARVEEWLKTHGRNINALVRGGQGETAFESKLTSHRFFCRLLGVDELTDTVAEMVEELILWNTLFEDRNILKDRIVKKYGRLGNGMLTAEQINKVCKRRFVGWGRLSKRLLCEVKTENIDGRRLSVMDVLEEGDPCGKHIGAAMVFMEILRDERLGFQKRIDAINKSNAAMGGYSIEDLPGSPALRRSVNQALRIIEEIVAIAGANPANIYIETTRDDDVRRKGQRTTRRYARIEEVLNAFKNEAEITPGLLEDLKECRGKDIDDRLALYFLQNGKCMYSGRPLDITRLPMYQIDHIIPQSYTKDDSLENKVLVYPSMNQAKSDQLLIPSDVRRSMAPVWRELHRTGMIGDKKFNNLMRSQISERQLHGFIARQLVETSQAIKYLRALLEARYGKTGVHSIKAGLTRQLREAEHFVKCREANDYHHAHDALLAAELGEFIEFRFGNIFDNPIGLEREMRAYIRLINDERKTKGRMPGDPAFIVGSFCREWADHDTGELWDGPSKTARIRHFLNYKNCYISRMPEITSGAFWDATIYSPKQGKKALELPLKSNLDAKKYGSYSREQFAYFFIYRAEKRGKPVLNLAPVPVSVAAEAERDSNALIRLGKEVSAKANVSFVCVERSKIYKYQKIAIDGEAFYITGKTEIRNGTELALNQKDMDVLARLRTQKDTEPEEREKLLESIIIGYEMCAKKLGAQMKIHAIKEKFADCSMDEQSEVLVSLIRIANAATNMIDLRAVGGSKYSGNMSISYSKLLGSNSILFEIVDQSVTGMFERRQRLGV